MIKFFLPLIAMAMIITSCNNKTKVAENKTQVEDNQGEIPSDDSSLFLLVGTYTNGESEGIYVYQFDTISAASSFKSLAKVVNPSYLNVSEDGKYVYSVSEMGDDTASANAFAFDKTNGTLSFLNSQKTSGADPCYIVVDELGKHVVTANYSGGNITVFDVTDNGFLTEASQVIKFTGKGVDPERQATPHLHCVAFSPDQRFLFANDLGTDQIYKFSVNESGEYLRKSNPASFKIAGASGPRHIVFHPNNKYAYLITELSGAIIAFSYDGKNGNLKEIQTIQADTLNAKGSADIHISPDGKFLYASNRLKGDGVAIFSINPDDGLLTKVGYQETGIHPRNFIFTPNGKFMLVACRDTNEIQIFAVDKQTGLLSNTEKSIKLDKPVCLKFTSFK